MFHFIRHESASLIAKLVGVFNDESLVRSSVQGLLCVAEATTTICYCLCIMYVVHDTHTFEITTLVSDYLVNDY